MINRITFKNIFIITAIVLAIAGFGYFLYCTVKPKVEPHQSLRLKAEQKINESLFEAKVLALRALKQAKATTDTCEIAKCYILLGRLDTYQGNNAHSLINLNEALSLAQKSKCIYEVCEAKLEIGDVHYTLGKYNLALAIFQQVLAQTQSNSFPELEAQALYHIGKAFYTLGNFPISTMYYEKSLTLCRKHNYYQLLPFILKSQGKYFISKGQLNLALRNYHEALAISEKNGDKMTIADVCNNLGGLYLIIDQPIKAVEYHKRALLLRKSVDNPEDISKSYNNIGKIFLDSRQPDSALFYLNKSFALNSKTGYLKGMVKCLINMGKTYILKKDYIQAFTHLNQAYLLAIHSNYDMGIAETSVELGNLSLANGQYNEAEVYYLKSLSILRSTNFTEQLNELYEGLYHCSIKKGKQAQALNYYIDWAKTREIIMNTENNRQLALLQIQFDSERTRKDMEVLRKDNLLKEMTIRRKSIYIWFSILILGLTIALCLLIYSRFRNKNKANKELGLLNRELDLAIKERDKLFSIIAHELRNPLYWFQTLSGVLSKNYQTMTSEKVQKSLMALDESAKNSYHLMDNLLQWSRSRLNRITPRQSRHNMASVANDTLQMYNTILSYKEITVQTEIDDDAHALIDPDLFSCVLRNIVSNAIKFTPAKGNINIRLIQGGSFHTLEVSDSGTGISHHQVHLLLTEKQLSSTSGFMNEPGSGLGLRLCKEFAELNGGTFWLAETTAQGSCFCFTVKRVE